MTEWLSGTLDVLCEVEYGTRVTRKRDGGTKYPVYGGGGATFNLDDFNREDQMIVSRFAMSEECVRFVPGKFFLNDSGLTVRTRDESKMSQEFLDQQLLARSNEIYATARGTAQKNMDMTMFRNMELAIPDSLEEQKRIVALLDAATARVTELTACYEQARTHANNLFASALRDALESNPDWPVKTLGDIVCFESETARSEDLSSRDVYVGLENIASDGTLIGLGSVSAETLKSNKARFTDKHILFGKLRPYLVKVVRPDFPGVCSTDILPLEPTAELSRDFLYWYMRSPAVIEGATEASTGTTLPRVSPTTLKSFEISVPPLEEQKRIVARLDLIRAKTSEMVAAYDSKLTAAKNLRQSILESAFEGKL